MNIFLQDLIYITLQEYKTSAYSQLKNSDDNEKIQVFISKAEQKIKNVITFEWDTPIAIKQATILLTDCLYNESVKVVKDKEIIEEKDENHTRKYKLAEKVDCMWWEVWELIQPYLKTKKVSTGAKFYRT